MCLTSDMLTPIWFCVLRSLKVTFLRLGKGVLVALAFAATDTADITQGGENALKKLERVIRFDLPKLLHPITQAAAVDPRKARKERQGSSTAPPDKSVYINQVSAQQQPPASLQGQTAGLAYGAGMFIAHSSVQARSLFPAIHVFYVVSCAVTFYGVLREFCQSTVYKW